MCSIFFIDGREGGRGFFGASRSAVDVMLSVSGVACMALSSGEPLACAVLSADCAVLSTAF